MGELAAASFSGRLRGLRTSDPRGLSTSNYRPTCSPSCTTIAYLRRRRWTECDHGIGLPRAARRLSPPDHRRHQPQLHRRGSGASAHGLFKGPKDNFGRRFVLLSSASCRPYPVSFWPCRAVRGPSPPCLWLCPPGPPPVVRGAPPSCGCAHPSWPGAPPSFRRAWRPSHPSSPVSGPSFLRALPALAAS